VQQAFDRAALDDDDFGSVTASAENGRASLTQIKAGGPDSLLKMPMEYECEKFQSH
jgi:hypothetical protein